MKICKSTWWKDAPWAHTGFGACGFPLSPLSLRPEPGNWEVDTVGGSVTPISENSFQNIQSLLCDWA